MDSQTPRENRRNEPHPFVAAPGETSAKVRTRPELQTTRKDVTCTEQFEDECLFEGTCGHLQYRQDADDARRPAYVRLPCGGVRYADRCAGKDSRPHQYEYDAALCQVLGGLDRPGDAEIRKSVKLDFRK